jgi:hypothetical protein
MLTLFRANPVSAKVAGFPALLPFSLGSSGSSPQASALYGMM